MNIKSTFLAITIFCLTIASAQAQGLPDPQNGPSAQAATVESPNVLDELNPFDPKTEELLNQYDQIYEKETGQPSHIQKGPFSSLFSFDVGCVRAECPLWVQVVKSQQKLYLYINGQVEKTWPVSTGVQGFTTPNLDLHPNGRIYDAYSSRIFPGGDFDGLGNMPYAVFLEGGIAIHGTTHGNWPRLGSVASHGCIRLHPENALYFNRQVRQLGVEKVWVTVQD